MAHIDGSVHIMCGVSYAAIYFMISRLIDRWKFHGTFGSFGSLDNGDIAGTSQGGRIYYPDFPHRTGAQRP